MALDTTPVGHVTRRSGGEVNVTRAPSTAWSLARTTSITSLMLLASGVSPAGSPLCPAMALRMPRHRSVSARMSLAS